MINKNSKIYIAGHSGLVGSAIVRKLQELGYNNLLLKTHQELDLTEKTETRDFFEKHQPEFVFLAAAKVGGILANDTYRAEFIHDNLAIQTNVIHESYRVNVKRLMFLGSSCIYPRDCPQPIKEEYLLTGALELTNRPYAVAKIAGIEMCWSYNRQYGTKSIAVMPTNMYGLGDNYHPENSHVLPALIRRTHESKRDNVSELVVWGSGKPLREFLYADDMAEACVYMISLEDNEYDKIIGDEEKEPPLINLGSGQEYTIKELAQTICKVIGYEGDLIFDSSKPDGTPRKLLDSSKLDLIGWRAKTDLEKGLFNVYKEFKLS